MIKRKMGRLLMGQGGFSLIEVIAALAISALIGVGASAASIQVLNQSAENNDYTTASRHTMNTVYWISRDVQMSQIVDPDGATGFPLTLSWTEWDNSNHQIIYSISGDTITRSYSISGGPPSDMVVAQYINSTSENTTCELTGGVCTITATSTIGSGGNITSVTQVREITIRPNL